MNVKTNAAIQVWMAGLSVIHHVNSFDSRIYSSAVWYDETFRVGFMSSLPTFTRLDTINSGLTSNPAFYNKVITKRTFK